MKITFLGTGTSSGVPVPTCQCEVCQSRDPRDRRLRASILVEQGDTRILIDCGPDFRYQALRADIRKISAVFLTHIHFDHSAGLDDLRIYSYETPLPFYAEPRVARVLLGKYDYVFTKPYPGAPHIQLNTILPEGEAVLNPLELPETDYGFTIDRPLSATTGHAPAVDIPEPAEVRSHVVTPLQQVTIGNGADALTVVPIRILHGQLPILGFRIGALAYLTDCTFIPDSEWSKLQGLDTLVIDALRWEPHRTHFSVSQALEVVTRLQPRQTFFTHMSHNIGFHEEAEKKLPPNVHFAYDTLSFDI